MTMRRGFAGQPSALERAQKQLQGKRLSMPPTGSASRRGTGQERRDEYDDDDDNDLDAYLSTLNRKVSKASGKQTKSVLSDDLSDLSISSDGIEGHDKPTALSASRFVKKSQSQTLEDSGSTRRKSEALSGGPTLKKSATAPNFLNKSTPAYASAALQKAAQLGAKFARQKRSADPLPDSESDFDISLSDDSDDRQAPKSKPKAKPSGGSREKLHAQETKKSSLSGHLQSSDEERPKRDAGQFLKKPARPSFYVSESDEGDDDGIGRDGNKFLKKPSLPKQAVTTPVATDAEGASGSRFLKKAGKEPPSQDLFSTQLRAKPGEAGRENSIVTSTPVKASDPRTGTSKLSRTAPGGATFGLDSDEEDLQDFIMNLSPSSSPDIPPIREHKLAGTTKEAKISPEGTAEKATPSRRPATPGIRKTLAARDVDSLSDGSELAEESAPSIGTESIEEENDFFKGIHTNVMQLEDLEPIGINVAKAPASTAPKPKPSGAGKYDGDIPNEISERSSIGEDIFAGLQTVDDLLLRRTSQRDSKPPVGRDSYKSDFESADEIASEADQSISEALSEATEALRRSGSKSPGEVYAEDTFASRTDSLSDTRTSTKTVPDSHSDVSSDEDTTRRQLASYSRRTGSESPPSRTRTGQSYTDDFHSRRTDSEVEDISRDDDSRHRTESVTHSRSYTSYTESRTLTRRDSPPRKGKRHGRKKEKSKDVAVQADGATSATHRWLRDLDLSALGTVTGIDPSPVAMYVINPQALEALTSYSPSILAMNEMLLSQLRHTQETVRASLRLHESLIENIETDFSYTTLENTKEYIRRHRRPKLTMEEALEEVKREMEEGYR